MDAEKRLRHEPDVQLWLQHSRQLNAAFLRLAKDITKRLATAQTVSATPALPLQVNREEAENAIRRLEFMLESGTADAEAFCAGNAGLLRQALGEPFDAVHALAREYEFERALDLFRQAQLNRHSPP